MEKYFDLPDRETVYKALQGYGMAQEALIRHYHNLVVDKTNSKMRGSGLRMDMFEPDDIIQEVEEKISRLMMTFK